MTMPDKALSRRIRQHIIAKEHKFFAIVQPGFENLAEEELRGMDINTITETVEGGIEFSSRLDACYRVNLCARTITRVIMRVSRFKATHFTRLRYKAQQIPWELYIGDGAILRFSVTSSNSRLYHTGRIREDFIKGAEARMKEYGFSISAGDEDRKNTEIQRVFIRIENDICTVSLDSSGEALYRRGYKINVAGAPLRETLASAILLAARLGNYDMLIDPMCGSGTFSIEAAHIFAGRPPGLIRDFAFRRWPAFHRAAFGHMVKNLPDTEREIGALKSKKIDCRDIEGKALEAARENIALTGFGDFILTERGDFLKEKIDIPGGRKALIVLNPPYGTRLGDPAGAAALYRSIGVKIRRDYAGCGYAIIVPGIEMEKVLSLTYDRKILFIHGGIKVAVIIRDGY